MQTTNSDKFRQQFAKIAKHILIGRKSLKLNLIETYTYTETQGIQLVKSIGQSIWEKCKGPLVSILGSVAAFVGPLGVGIGVIGLIAIAGYFIYQDITNPKKKQTLQGKLMKVLRAQKIQQCQSYLQSFIFCFKNEDSFIKMVKELSKIDNKKVPSREELTELIKNKNILFKKIQKINESMFDIEELVILAQLYYMYVKVIIQMTALRWNNQIGELIEKLLNQHKKVNSIVIQSIKTCLHHQKQYLTIKGSEKRQITIYDKQRYLVQNLFADFIFDEIFRCPITGKSIKALYNVDVWKGNSNKKNFCNLIKQKSINTNPYYQKYLGPKKQLPSSYTLSHKDHRISRLMLIGQQKWAPYFQNIKNKDGWHSSDYGSKNSSDPIDLKRCKAIYLDINKKKICWLDFDYQIHQIKITYNKDNIEGPDFTYCIELDSDEAIIAMTATRTNIKFQIQKVVEVQINTKKNSSFFDGYIQTPDKKYRLGYGMRNFWTFSYSSGYTFHKTDEKDLSQKLIFSQVVPKSFYTKQQLPKQYSSDKIIKSFTCKISTKANNNMYMARDDRQQKQSVFGNNKSGGQLIYIVFSKRKGKNQYEGQIQVIDPMKHYLKTYLDKDYDLKWSIEGKSTKFNINFDQQT